MCLYSGVKKNVLTVPTQSRNALHVISITFSFIVCSRAFAQGGCGCPIPAGIQGKAGGDPGQPDLVVGSLAYGGKLELDDF